MSRPGATSALANLGLAGFIERSSGAVGPPGVGVNADGSTEGTFAAGHVGRRGTLLNEQGHPATAHVSLRSL